MHYEKLIVILNAGVFFCNTIIFSLIKQAKVINYIECFLALLCCIIQIIKYVLEENQLANKEWKSNEDLKDYCIKKWNATLSVAGIKDDNDNYINIIYNNMNDIAEHSDNNKFWWRLSERMLIILVAVITLLNAIAAAVPSKPSFWINIAAAVVAAFVSIFNGIKVLAAYKETWLRHSKSRAELDMECHKFAANIGDYAVIDSSNLQDDKEKAEAKIKKFKENTTKIIQDDYDKFFANMSKN